jgi:RNA polymerase sigma factor (sigma-70 family)
VARIRWADGDRAPAGTEMSAAERGRLEHLLARGACLGDDGALEALCRDQWLDVYRTVSGSAGDRIEAEELTQEVFATAIAGLSQFPHVSLSFRSYLLQIARRLLRERWRDEDQDAGSSRDTAKTVQPFPETPGPETIVLATSQRRRLATAIDRLPGRFRDVLHLQLFEGRAADEIAAEWGRRPEAVRRIEDEALVSLRSELEGTAAR